MTTSPNLPTIYITFYPAIDMYGFFYALWDEISILLQGIFLCLLAAVYHFFTASENGGLMQKRIEEKTLETL